MGVHAWVDGPAGTWSVIAGSALVGVGTWLFYPGGRETTVLLAITVFCIGLWITTPIQPSFTGLIGVGLIGVAFSTDLALVGFRKSAMWLVVFGLVMGEATAQSGLARWGSVKLLAAIDPGVGGLAPRRAYRRLLVALCLGGLALAVLVPSSLVRVLILAPILREVGGRFESRQVAIGLFLGPLIATFYGSVGILTAGLPNIIIVEIAESLGAPTVSWTEWGAYMFVVMGIGRVLVVAGVVYLLFPPDVDADSVTLPQHNRPLAPAERRMGAFLAVGVLFWVTDLVHGFHPMFGALLVVVLAFLPGLGVVDFDAIGEIDFSIIFFLAAIFAIGDGLAATGFTDAVATSLLDAIPQSAPLAVLLALVFGVTVLLTFLLEGLAVASVLTPVLVAFSQSGAAPLLPVLMTEAIALNTYFFPYQSAVLVAILAQDVAETGELIKAVAACSVSTTVVLLPLQLGVFTVAF